MATTNFSNLNETVVALFGVIETIIAEVVDLLTGDLLVLVLVGALVGLIIGLIYMVLRFVRGWLSSSMQGANMKK
jgi:predicted lysophospholipase L1 biosynthesis ABC-type transport system permease subunit